MKLHFSNVDFSSRTGPNTFGTRLAECLYGRGYEIVGHNDNYDIFLCFIEPASIPNPRAKFIQRLDGIWFKPETYVSHNQKIKWAYDNSDYVVWQSCFDKNMIEKYWGSKHGLVVHNGIKRSKLDVSADILSLRKSKDKIFVCAANWHRQKRLKENIELFQKVAGTNDVLVVLGSNFDVITNDSRIMYAGNQQHDICLQLYSISDWFIHLAWLDHCPNVVVEALSQGCPIICTDSGGTHEIVRNNGLIIKEKYQYQYELCDYDNPPDIDLDVVIGEKINVNADYIDIENVANMYEKAFQDTMNS
jgi:glycosyltransferase involved in cell wall biosynthesis